MNIYYRNCVLLDGTKDMVPQPNMTVVTEDGIIKAVQPDGKVPEGVSIVDLNGQYLMPGLINMHVHLPASGKPSKTDSKKLVHLIRSSAILKKGAVKLCEIYAKTELMSGCTTIRTVGGIDDLDTIVRDSINAGSSVGPRILAADYAVTVKGGHMVGTVAKAAESIEETVKMVDDLAKYHPDLIKIMITGGVLDATKIGEPGVLRMQPEYVKAACDEAHRLGLYVAAHVESPEGVRVALENGVDTIEHGAKPDEQIINLFREKKAKLITTISPALPFAEFDPAVSGCDEMGRANGKIVFDGVVECSKAALANDIPVGLGTDTGCPFVTHYDMWRELNYFCKYVGVSPAFALYTATLRNAEIAGIADVTGSIAPGKSADFIVSEKNPLEDFANLRKLQIVVMKGHAYRSPKVKKYPAIETELDKWL